MIESSLPTTASGRRASCGGQQTAEARTKDGDWFYHTVSAATPPDKRRTQLFHQVAGEQDTQHEEEEDGTVSQQWSVGSSKSRSIRRGSIDSNGTLQFERTREITGNMQDSILARISTLRALCDEGFISEEEYERYVAKLAIDPDEDPQTYFRDIELQAHCAHYAQVYNSYIPPKRVEFIPAWVLELPERNGALCAVEAYIPGEYRKHNNNFGSVSDDERNTPQAFSHFTYEASNHELLAVDIQGVGDLYTDPQIHTLNGHDFGKGNLGVLGFQKFLSSHRCNSICRYLKLPPVNPKSRHADSGTLPVQELMNRDRVRPTHFDSRHYYENAPMLQKYVTQYRDMGSRLSSSSSATSFKNFRKRRLHQSGFANFCNTLFCCGS
ncbi:hypothetical protein BBP00_00000506 [Phytophthora kernoviae]|uniref:Alpha-type protein kinase domain-containing protein n=1 Tax=Phytophthora kernoviae TaxID=325452 RepID=A0A3F2S2Y0_9STRA|nr:hypothetical protein BBP00_00000506 [Phytophthora kernoviae]